MDTNKNNQLLHTFEKGMDTDTSDSLLESGKYRYAENLRYLTGSGKNTGELHSIEGWTNTNITPYPTVSVKSYGEPVQHGEYCTEGDDELYYMEDSLGIREFDIQGIQFNKGDLCCYNNEVYVCIIEEGETASAQFDYDEWRIVHLDDLVDNGYITKVANNVILSTTSIRDIGVHVVKDPLNRWFVFKQQKDDNSTTIVFGPCTETIANGYKNKLSLVTRWEDDDNIKLYIADGEHEIMVINLSDPVVYTDIESITNTTTSRLSKPEVSKYSSLSLQIIEFGKPIKTGLYYFNDGQLYEFVGSAGQQSIDEWKLVPYGVGYYCSYENKIYKSYSTTQAAEFDFAEWVEQSVNDLISDRVIEHKTLLEIPEAQVKGMLKPAIVQYSYRLYKKNQTSSVISPISVPIIIDTVKNEITYGIPHGKYSSTGVNITIDTSLVFNKYDKIIIYRIVYEVAGQNPTIDIIYDNELTSYDNKFSLNDDGRDAISTITVAEYNSYDGINIVPKTIESKGDYLFASNVEYIKQDAFKNWDARSYTTGNYYIKNGVRVYPATDINLLDEVPLDATIMHENWSLSDTYDSEQWKDDLGNSYSGIGLNISWQLITEEKVLDSHASNQVGINKNSTNSTKSLQRGEIYRYAIVLYHKDGYKSEAKWIADIRIPDQSVIDGQDPITNPFKLKTEGEDPSRYRSLYAYNIGIRFYVYNLPEDCIGYEIVRADRTIADRATITQGVVSRTISPYDSDEEIKLEAYRIPTGFITFDSMSFLDGSGQSSKTSHNYNKGINEELLFFSPETSYQSDDLSNIMSSYNVKLNLLNWVNPLLTRVPASGSSVNANIISASNNRDYINPSILTNRIGVNTGMYFLILSPSGNNLYLHTLYYPCSRTYEFEPETDVQRHIYAINANKLTSDINASFITSKEAYTPICYVKLYEKSDFNIDQTSIDIDNSKILNSKQYSDFADSNENIQILNHNVAINLSTVSQWISPSIFKQSLLSTVKNRLKDFNKDNEYSDSLIGISGKALILKQSHVEEENANNLFYQYANKIDNLSNRDLTTFFGTFVCNIKKYTNPYGGQENSAKVNNKYISHGNYVDKDLNTVDVYDGDCNIVCFECTTMHDWYHPTLNRHMNMNVVYSIPLETTIDVDRDYGDRYSKLNSNSDTINRDLNFLQAEATNFREWFVQTKPMYQYNTAYSIQPFVLYYTGMSKEEIEDFKYDYRVHYSNQKINNEQIDSWTLFKSANYLDVDTRYGEITNLRLFKDRLLFWLNEAVGLLSVNERTILQDLNDYNIILGNGDVLQRYDYITTEYGMKPDQYVDGQSSTCLYWWDGYKKEILAYAGEGIVPTGRTNSIYSYLSKLEEGNPTLAYDDKYHEMLCSIDDDTSLVFNEVIKAYTGIYTIGFKNKINFVDQLLLCDKKNNVKKWNSHEYNTKYMPSKLEYVVNNNPIYTKVYDDMLFECTPDPYGEIDSPEILFTFNTPLNQTGEIEANSDNCSKRERDFRMRIPRAKVDNLESTVGNRLRGKTMSCELTSTTNKTPLSLQYIITKFRISWS